ncbi:hypothetical protein ACTXN9_09085, partial [Corynebacterium casei]
MADHAHNLRADAVAGRPFGVITRGTTGHNRLRRCDRWMAYHPEISWPICQKWCLAACRGG